MLYQDEGSAREMTYSNAGKDKIIIDHTERNPKFSGKGYGKDIVMSGVTFAREKGIKIIPLCPYAKKVFDHDEKPNDIRF